MKSLLSILAGFITWTALFLVANQVTFRLFRDRFNEDMVTNDTMVLGLTLLLTVAYSILAGYVTARFSPQRPVAHGVALGLLQTVIGVAVQSGYWNVIPSWYNVAFVVLLLPATFLGAFLWAQRIGKHEAAA